MNKNKYNERLRKHERKSMLWIILVFSTIIFSICLCASHKKGYGQEIYGEQQEVVYGFGYKLLAVDTAIADTLAEVLIYQPSDAAQMVDYLVLQYLYPDKNRDMRLKHLRINGERIGDGPYLGIGQQKLTLPKPVRAGEWTLSYLLPGENIKTEIIPLVIEKPTKKYRLYY